MANPPLTLPIEVCERVLDLLPPEFYSFRISPNPQILFNCCLVCRAWVPRSRLHLYTSVWLHPSNLTEFVRGISLQPPNGHLVRELSLTDVAHDRAHHKLSLVPLQLPQLLPNLRHIQLHWIRLTGLHPKFYTYLSRFRSVHSIDLSVPLCPTIMQLARCLTAFSHLDECEMYLNLGTFQSLSFPGARLPTKRIPVSKLNLRMPCDPQVVGPILDIFSPPSTRSLSIELESLPSEQEEVGQLVASFVTRCAGALSELTLDRRGWDYLDLSQNTSLMSLGLSMLDAPAKLSHRFTISRALSTICSTHLKELRLGISIETDSKDTISPAGWDALDATLALPTFRKVEYISIGVMVVPPDRAYTNSPQSRRVSERTVRQLFPQLAARSVADFSIPKYLPNPVEDFEISSLDLQDTLELETVDSLAETPQLDD